MTRTTDVSNMTEEGLVFNTLYFAKQWCDNNSRGVLQYKYLEKDGKFHIYKLK